MSKKRKRKVGRRSKYYSHVEPRLIEIEGWARDGLIEEQIARNLGVAVSTFNTYKNKFPELTESLKKGKEVVDRQVENALLKRALGYQYTETTYVQEPMTAQEYHQYKTVYMNKYKLENPEATQEELRLVELQLPRTKRVIEQERVKEVVPDTTAQIFWLKNRKPEHWRDKRDIEHSGGINITEKAKEIEDYLLNGD